MSTAVAETCKIALVTGANRGIGFEVTRKLVRKNVHVVLGCRSVEFAGEAVRKLREEVPECSVDTVEMDTSSEKSMTAAVESVVAKYGRIDVLVNNAAILYNPDATVLQISIEDTLDHIKVNALGPLKMIQLVLPVMLKNNYGRIVNVSSISGSIDNLLNVQKYREFPETSYRISKSVLNHVTALVEDWLRPGGIRGAQTRPNILVNSVCPGWARTRMGGETAELDPADAAEVPAKLALSPDDGPTGKFFRGDGYLGW
eukprot:TRINITY_DN5692_c1_g1_i1.p1 TRINITY_DN5692_c1_g1~~TRINITY_DN5692_c1_g1_i1.p1  ORF type:complete len:258 (+),score=30.09 TRINITY_DN5692_c1_g1_i1:116-889(+)